MSKNMFVKQTKYTFQYTIKMGTAAQIHNGMAADSSGRRHHHTPTTIRCLLKLNIIESLVYVNEIQKHY